VEWREGGKEGRKERREKKESERTLWLAMDRIKRKGK